MYRRNEKLLFKGLEPARKTEMIEELKNSVAPDDVVAGILASLTVEEIPLDVKRIHTAVYKLKQKYPEMLKPFVFTEKDYYPYSVLLERVLFRLQNADLINTINPDFKVCIISNSSKNHIKKYIVPLFKEEDREKLIQMGKAFQNYVSPTT
jgi:hypothetical protein